VLEATELGDYSVAVPTLSKAFAIIDKNVKRGILHKNTAARTKSRLHLKVSAHAAAVAAAIAAAPPLPAWLPSYQLSTPMAYPASSALRSLADVQALRTQLPLLLRQRSLTTPTDRRLARLQVKALEGGAPAAPAAAAAPAAPAAE